MMNKQVIHIFGASGSGTTTLGRYLSEELGYFHMDTDDYFWEPTDPPYTVKRLPARRVELLRRDITLHEQVVLSGSLAGWGDPLIPLFTLAIRLVVDTDLRIERIRVREREKLGSRIDPGGDLFRHHQEFLQWAAAYDSAGPNMRSRAKHDLWQQGLPCPVLVLDGGAPLAHNLAAVQKHLTGEPICATPI